jgi:hypothetical protein
MRGWIIVLFCFERGIYNDFIFLIRRDQYGDPFFIGMNRITRLSADLPCNSDDKKIKRACAQVKKENIKNNMQDDHKHCYSEVINTYK